MSLSHVVEKLSRNARGKNDEKIELRYIYATHIFPRVTKTSQFCIDACNETKKE